MRKFKDRRYPLCHLLLQKRFDDRKDAFENARLVDDVNSLDPDGKAVLRVTVRHISLGVGASSRGSHGNAQRICKLFSMNAAALTDFNLVVVFFFLMQREL